MRFQIVLFRRRGVAVIIAISVLAILTIIVLGLGAVYQVTASTEAVGANRQMSLSLVHTGLDLGRGLLAQKPGEILGRTRTINLENAVVAVSGREASPADAFYAGKFLDHRPGDAVLTIRVQHGKEARMSRLTQEFLVNATSGRERVVRLAERIAERPVMKEADKPAAPAPEKKGP